MRLHRFTRDDLNFQPVVWGMVACVTAGCVLPTPQDPSFAQQALSKSSEEQVVPARLAGPSSRLLPRYSQASQSFTQSSERSRASRPRVRNSSCQFG